jgi:deoxyribose-phosphate aldolase
VNPLPGTGLSTAAVCVLVPFVALAREALAGSGVRVATVAGDFPRGVAALDQKVAEIRTALAAGADEVDVVVDRRPVLAGDFRSLGREVEAFRDAAGRTTLKVILATGELGSPRRIARASRTALEAGADFLKTSTGFERVNATVEAGRAMAGALREFQERTGAVRGLKAAGGIRTAGQALEWREMVLEELGRGSLDPHRFRIGASALLDDLVRTHAAEGAHPGEGPI